MGADPGVQDLGLFTGGHDVCVDVQDGHRFVATHVFGIGSEEPL
jgi:hypothetical protein